MCMEDIRVMRGSQSRILPISVTNAAGEILAASMDRVALILGPPNAGTITYSDQDNPAAGSGLNLAAGADPVQLSIQMDGEIVTHRWWAIADAAGPRLAALIETLLDKK